MGFLSFYKHAMICQQIIEFVPAHFDPMFADRFFQDVVEFYGSDFGEGSPYFFHQFYDNGGLQIKEFLFFNEFLLRLPGVAKQFTKLF